MIKFVLGPALLIFLCGFYKPADSPLTSTDFSQAYFDIPMVKEAADSGTLTPAMVQYLMAPETPIDVKAAVVNALGWSFEGKERVALFLELAHNNSKESLDTDALPGDVLMVIGYLQALDDYFHPEKALGWLFMAQRKLPKSYTVNMIYGLVRAQTVFDLSWCETWRSIEDVIRTKKLKMDMREEANGIILEYMRLYEDSCR